MLDWPKVRPVLDATYALLDDHDHVDGSKVCEALGREGDDKATMRALVLLREQGLIEGHVAFGPRVDLIQPTPEGLRLMRGWPRPGEVDPQSVSVLLAVLDERIAAAGTDDERSRWQRLRDTAGGFSQAVLAEAFGAWAARLSGAG